MPALHTVLDGKVRSCFIMYPHPVSHREQILNNICSAEFPNLLAGPVLLLDLRSQIQLFPLVTLKCPSPLNHLLLWCISG